MWELLSSTLQLNFDDTIQGLCWLIQWLRFCPSNAGDSGRETKIPHATGCDQNKIVSSDFGNVDGNLISRSKKKNGKFIPDKFEDYNLGRASQKALRTVRPTRSQDIAYLRHFWDRELYIKWHTIDGLPNPDRSAIVVGHVTLYKIKKECYLLRSCLLVQGECCCLWLSRYFCL